MPSLVGTTANHNSFSPILGSSSDISMKDMSGASFLVAFVAFWDALDSDPTLTFRLKYVLPYSDALIILALTPFITMSTLAARSLLDASLTLF